MLAQYETQEYRIPVAGRMLRVLGPKYPHALNDEPRYRQSSEADGYKPTWAQPWPAAVMLAEHVIASVSASAESRDGLRADHDSSGGKAFPHRACPPSPQSVLELGAGLGIAGLALAMAGFRVVITDYDEDALLFVRASAALNAVELHDVRRLDWRQPPAERFPLIIGSDIVFEKRHHAALAALLAACLEPDGRAFFSDQNRTAADAFPHVLAAVGFACDIVRAQAKAIPGFDSIDGRILNGRILCVTHQPRHQP
jgi:2-polyprenyl-3-methyl-5-hydroxy-6-metoxy-1,4-benzoquinol methylase